VSIEVEGIDGYRARQAGQGSLRGLLLGLRSRETETECYAIP
jgi:hypothetical protein